MSKNPYHQDSPEWQLFANAEGCELQAVTYTADAERYAQMAQRARDKAARFREALKKIDPNAGGA